MATKKRKIDDEIEHILTALASMEVSSKEYEVAVRNLQVLYEARSRKPSRLSEFDTVIKVTGGIVGTLLILNYERLHVISTKALGIALKYI